jgi:hypothetical protein
MQANIIIRSEHADAGIPPRERTETITRQIRSMSDEELANLAVPRSKSQPGRGLRAMAISLPADVLERLQRFKGSHWSVSALIDRLLTDGFVEYTQSSKGGEADEQ